MSIESIRHRVGNATPGPWYFEVEPSASILTTRVGVEGHRRGVGDYAIAVLDGDPIRPEQGADALDAKFIAHARQDIPALLAVAEAAADIAGPEHERLLAALAALEALP